MLWTGKRMIEEAEDYKHLQCSYMCSFILKKVAAELMVLSSPTAMLVARRLVCSLAITTRQLSLHFKQYHARRDATVQTLNSKCHRYVDAIAVSFECEFTRRCAEAFGFATHDDNDFASVRIVNVRVPVSRQRGLGEQLHGRLI